MNKKIVLRIVSVFLIFSLIPLISTAASSKKKIDVIYQGIKLVVDNVEKKVSPEPFIYNGSVYIPAKSVAEALGKKYTFKNNKVYISNTGTAVKEYREIYLAKRPYLSADGGEFIKIKPDTVKEPTVDLYYDFLSKDGTYSLTYALNAQAKLLSCSIGTYPGQGFDSSEISFSFYDENDKLLYSSGIMKKGMDLLPISINVTGVLQIKIKTTVSNAFYTYPYFKDLKILTTDY